MLGIKLRIWCRIYFSWCTFPSFFLWPAYPLEEGDRGVQTSTGPLKDNASWVRILYVRDEWHPWAVSQSPCFSMLVSWLMHVLLSLWVCRYMAKPPSGYNQVYLLHWELLGQQENSVIFSYPKCIWHSVVSQRVPYVIKMNFIRQRLLAKSRRYLRRIRVHRIYPLTHFKHYVTADTCCLNLTKGIQCTVTALLTPHGKCKWCPPLAPLTPRVENRRALGTVTEISLLLGQ